MHRGRWEANLYLQSSVPILDAHPALLVLNYLATYGRTQISLLSL